MTARFRAIIEYDGSGYCGFQRQKNHRTIQEELEQALERISGDRISVAGAGRTDSGVHARGQVIAFDLAWSHGPSKLQRALNANLPGDIAALDLAETNKVFHPRFSARHRAYEYRIYNYETRSPLMRQVSWHVSQPLNVGKMQTAADSLVGVQDFATFGRPIVGENTVRNVMRAEWSRRGNVLTFEVVANAFLNRMVRSLVGTMKAVGEGKWTVEEFVAAFRARDRSRAGQTAPPHALFLVSVAYD